VEPTDSDKPVSNTTSSTQENITVKIESNAAEAATEEVLKVKTEPNDTATTTKDLPDPVIVKLEPEIEILPVSYLKIHS